MPRFETERPLVDVLADLIAHLHVPRSLDSVMVPKEYDEVRWLIGDTGWSQPDEIARRLRDRLEYESVQSSHDTPPQQENKDE